MIHTDADADAFATVCPSGRLLGLDLGDRTIGIAISDPARTLATPLKVIARRKFTQDAQALMALMAEWEIAGLVLGLPRNMDGSEGPRAQKSRSFAGLLVKTAQEKGAGAVPLLLWDERLSTVAAERRLIRDMDVSRRRRAQAVDQLAAAHILQGALDRLTQGSADDYAPRAGQD